MRLFIWKDVLTDYTSGGIAVMANSLEEARTIAINSADDWERKTVAADMSKPPDEIHDGPACLIVWGGG